MKIHHQTTGSFLQTMLTEREEPLILKMNEQLQNILGKSTTTQPSPTRKKSSTQINFDAMTTDIEPEVGENTTMQTDPSPLINITNNTKLRNPDQANT
jgi:hypothetical protein